MEPEELGEQTKRLGEIAAHITGRLKAMEYAVRMLITTHPEPEKAFAMWNGVLPTVLDEHETYPSFQDEGYRQAFQEGLSLWSQTFDGARFLKSDPD